MCQISDYLQAKQTPDGTMYLVIWRPPFEEYVDGGHLGDSQWGALLGKHADKSELGLAGEALNRISVREVNSCDTEVVWNVVAWAQGLERQALIGAVSSHADEVEEALSD